MALVSTTKPRRYDMPHEGGEWVELRLLSTGAFSELPTDLSARQMSLAILKACLVGWSYDQPITDETLGDLDMTTFAWLDDILVEAVGLRSLLEKKGSNGDSPPTSGLAKDESPENSDT